MTYRELIKQIEDAGWRFHRTGRGSHMIFRHADHPKAVVISHGGKLSRDVPEGTKNAVLRQAGLR